jgi:hypothetical protein
MKRFIFSAFLFCSLVSMAQNALIEGQPALMYSLPKTKLCLEVEVEKTTRKPGIFYRYSERYLATTNVITSEKTEYKLKSVSIVPVAVPDSTRTYKIAPDAKSQLSHITVTPEGLLCGVNVPAVHERKMIVNKTISSTGGVNTALLPLGEEYMMAGSEAKMAEGAAKQIYRVRESRLSLLTADVEKMPADGASLKTMLEGLDKMERQITELFTGSVTTDVQTQKLYITPSGAASNDLVFRLSALRGLVAADDMSGAPYYITIKPQTIPMTAADAKTKAEPVGIYYSIPASTDIVVTDGVNTIAKVNLLIPQFGKVVPLPAALFRSDKVKAVIDPQTGRLLQF